MAFEGIKEAPKPLGEPLGGYAEITRVDPSTAEGRAMGAALESPNLDLNKVKDRIETGAWDFNLDLESNLRDDPHPFAGLGNSPDKIAQEKIAEAILSETTTKGNRHLQEMLRDNPLGILAGIGKFYTNWEYMQEKMQSTIHAMEADRNIADKVIDAYDWFGWRAMTLGWLWEYPSDYGRRLGQEIFENSVNMSEEEFKAYFNNVHSNLMDEGFFKEENLNAVYQRLGEIEKQGLRWDGDAAQALSILDLTVAFGGPAIRGMSRLGKGVASALKVADLTTPNKIAQALKSSKVSPQVKQNAIHSALNTGNQTPPNATATQAVTPPALTAAPTGSSSGIIQRIMETSNIVAKWKEVARRLDEDAWLNKALATRMSMLDDLVGTRSVGTGQWRVSPRNIDAYETVVELGTTKGNPFALSNKSGAERVASKIKEGQPVKAPLEVNVIQTKSGDGWVVEVKSDVLEKDLMHDIDVPAPKTYLTSLLQDSIGRWFRSTSSIEDKTIGSMFSRRAENLSKFMNDLETDFRNVARATPLEERRKILDLIEYIANGPDSTKNLMWWDRTTLEANYLSVYGDNLSEQGWKFYDKFVETNDFALFADASIKLKNWVELGFGKLVSQKWGGWVQTRMATPVRPGAAGDFVSISSDDWIVDLSVTPGKGGFLRKKDLKNTKVVHKFDEPMDIMGRKVKYAINPDDVKMLTLDDVSGYNAGPTRTYANARNFLVGKTDGKSPITFMTTSSRSEAERAVHQINTIMKEQKAGNPNLDNIILSNNEWNPNIKTVKDFDDFVDKHGIKGREILWKNRDEKVRGDIDSDVWSDQTWDSYFRSKSRGEVLMNFGGEPAYNTTPLVSLSRQLTKSSHRLAFNQATLKQKLAFVEELRKEYNAIGGIKLPEKIDTSSMYDIERIIRETEISGVSPRHARLRSMRQAIWNRMNLRTPFDEMLRKHGDQVMEWLYDTTNGKYFKTRIERGDALERFILSYNFHTTMGLFEQSQIFIQGMSAFAAAAMSPKYGIAALASQKMFWSLAVTGNQKLRMGVARKLEELSKATFNPIPAEVWIESMDHLQRTGRAHIHHTVQELGTLDQLRLGPSAFWKGLLNKSALPFTMGERLSRSTATIIAHAEYRALNPKAKFRTPEADNWISHRENALTLNMNTANHSAAQRGVARIPLQWTSYMFRVSEALATGGHMGLSVGERARLGLFLTVGMGIGHFGKEGAAAGITEWLGFDPGEDFYKYVQSGIIDGLLNQIGVDISVSDRVSLVASYKQFYEHIMGVGPNAEGITGLILGPANSVFKKDAANFLDVASDLVNGRYQEMTVDTIDTLRGVKGIDNVAAALGILQHGFYRSRTGQVFGSGEMSPEDAAIYLLGFKKYEHAEMLRATSKYFDKVQNFKEVQKYFRKKYQKVWAAQKAGDLHIAGKLLKEIGIEIQFYPNISPSERRSLQRMVLSGMPNRTEDIILDWIDRGEWGEIEAMKNIREDN